MKTIVISGKSGSGKSYIANLLAKKLNCKVFDLDQISHQTLTLENVKDFVRRTFSAEVFENDTIITKKLGKIAFFESEKLNQLNNLCHEEMVKIIDKKLTELDDEYVILDYLLLPKMKYFKTALFKILIKTDDVVRKNRILSRDNISSEYFDARESNSITFNDNDFDFVADGSSNIDIDKLTKQIVKKSQK